ncbi:unnamed protein product, partial [marine sediment metagenome]
DNDIDVIGASANYDDISWWENDGSENFTEHVIDSNLDGAIAVYAIDIDNDTDIDVLSAARDADDISWWENDLVGIEEEDQKSLYKDDYISTIIYGPLVLPEVGNYKIFDITGREVDAAHLALGIYFIELDGRITNKVVKVR